MKPSFFLSAIVIFAVLLIFPSCKSDETITGISSNDVKGTVLDFNGNPVHPAKVWLNYEAVTDVNADGTFMFKNVRMPYRLTAKNQLSTEFFVYEGLSSLNPKIYVNTAGIVYINQACIIISLPSMPVHSRRVINFLSSDKEYSGIEYSGFDTTVVYYVRWKGNSQRISGKLAVLQYRTGENGRIFLYDKFGLKDTSVSVGETIYIRYEASDLQFNPPESQVSINFPQGSSNGVYLALTFDDCGRYSNMNLEGIQGSNIPASYVVPASLPVDFLIQANLTYEGGYSQLYVHPGSTINVPVVQKINLISPMQWDTADYNTDFIHDGNSNVYITFFSPNIQPPYFSFNVISSYPIVRMPILPFFGINPYPGMQVGWWVNGYNGFSGMNEFASDKRIARIPYNVVYCSGARQFILRVLNP
jgi:hypothetical protein